jgi:hypothetical protein
VYEALSYAGDPRFYSVAQRTCGSGAGEQAAQRAKRGRCKETDACKETDILPTTVAGKNDEGGREAGEAGGGRGDEVQVEWEGGEGGGEGSRSEGEGRDLRKSKRSKTSQESVLASATGAAAVAAAAGDGPEEHRVAGEYTSQGRGVSAGGDRGGTGREGVGVMVVGGSRSEEGKAGGGSGNAVVEGGRGRGRVAVQQVA